MSQETHSLEVTSDRRQQRSRQRPDSQQIRGEAVHLRNYDHESGYDLTLEVVDAATDEQVLDRQLYLPPGAVESLRGGLPAGIYTVTATLDNRKQETLTCRIDNSFERTVVVEIGNGVMSVTSGVTR